MHRTPLGDPWVCHVYYGAIGTVRAIHHWVTHGYATYTTTVLWERGYVRRTPLGDPRVCHVYYGTLGEGLCAPYTIG